MDKLLVAFFLLNSVNLFCQPEGLTKKKIADNGIYKVTAFLDMESDDLQFENMDVRFFKFNQASKERELNVFTKNSSTLFMTSLLLRTSILWNMMKKEI